jgi:molecular chaperone GrpE
MADDPKIPGGLDPGPPSKDQAKDQKDQTKESSGSPSNEEELDTRKNAAKAFYRALYSGENVVPDDFGMVTQKPTPERSTGPCPNCSRLESDLKENEQKAQENEKYYKRIAADFENYRKRTDREREEAVSLGVQRAVEAMLPALDDLDRAKSSLGNVTDPKAVVESLTLVFQRFNKCLEPLGVKQLEAVGVTFDPKFHEPVQEIVTTEFPDGAVAQELRRGYMLKDKVIRPTLVNVASNASGVVTPKAPTQTPQPAEESAPQATGSAPADTGSGTTHRHEDSSPDPPADSEAADNNARAAQASNEVHNKDTKVEDEDFDPKSTSEHLPVFSDGLELNTLNTSMGELSQKDVSKVDEAANQQRAQNALERLRSKEKKQNPKVTVELPAYKPDQTESVTADDQASGNGSGSSSSTQEAGQTASEAKAAEDDTDKPA